MSDQIPDEKTGWWSRQSSNSKAVIGIAGFCCIGLIVLVIIGGMMAPDATNYYNNSSNTDSSSGSINTSDNTDNTTTTPTPVETEAQYKASCKKISFKQLEKNPEAHSGERIKVSGRVVQIMEGYGTSDIRMDVNDNYGDTVYITYTRTTSAVEDSMITVWGEVVGSYTYESQAGWQITLPQIEAKYVSVN